jgi:hypothetical protein
MVDLATKQGALLSADLERKKQDLAFYMKEA